MKKEIKKLSIPTTFLIILGIFYGFMVQARVSNDINDTQMPMIPIIQFQSDFDRLVRAIRYHSLPLIKILGVAASPYYLTGTCYQRSEVLQKNPLKALPVGISELFKF